MKLLYIVPTKDPKYGGPVEAVNSYVYFLTQKNIEIKILPESLHTTTVYLLPFFKGIKLTYFPGVKELIKIRDNIKNVDLIHVNGLWSAPTSLAAYFARKNSKPYLVTLHGMLDEWCLNQNPSGKRLHSFLLERKNLNSASAIHCLNEYEIKSAKDFGVRAPLFELPNGVDLNNFNFIPDKGNLIKTFPHLKDKTIVLFLGRINHKKGFDLLIPAFSQALKESPDLHLIIAGSDEGKFIENVKNLIFKNTLDSYVTFTGFVSGELKKTLLMGSDIFILPSYQEGDSVAIKEAMASRLPVIITPACHFPEIEKHNAGVIVNHNVEAISEAILKLGKNAELRWKIGGNGRKLVEEKYNWNKIVEQMIIIYEDILNNRFTSPCWRI